MALLLFCEPSIPSSKSSPTTVLTRDLCHVQHLEKTPNEYIRWRYAIGEDRENLSKVTRKISDEELAKMQQQFKMEDGTKRVLEKLVARRKLKKQYEYEVQWKGFDPTQNSWMPRDK